jgi:hypothetical protein
MIWTQYSFDGVKSLGPVIQQTLAAKGTYTIHVVGNSQTEGVDTITAGGETIGRPVGWPAVTSGVFTVANPTAAQLQEFSYLGKPASIFGTRPSPTDVGHGDVHRSPNAYPALLQAYLRDIYGSGVTVKNCGYAGKTTNWLDYYLEEITFAKYGVPDMMIYSEGTNETISSEFTAAAAEKLILSIYTKFKGRNPKGLFVLASPQFITLNTDDSVSGSPTRSDSGDAGNEVIPMLKSFAKAHNVPFVDVNAAQVKLYSQNTSGRIADKEIHGGLHYRDAGHPFIAELFASLLLPNVVEFNGGEENVFPTNSRIGCVINSDRLARPPITGLDPNDFTTYPDKYSRAGRHYYISNVSDGIVNSQPLYSMWVMVNKPCSLIYMASDCGYSADGSPTDAEAPTIDIFNKGDLVTPWKTVDVTSGFNTNAAERRLFDRPQEVTYNLPIGLNKVVWRAPAAVKTGGSDFLTPGWFQLTDKTPNLRNRQYAGGAVAWTADWVTTRAASMNGLKTYTIPATTIDGVFDEVLENAVMHGVRNTRTIIRVKGTFTPGVGLGLTMGRWGGFNGTFTDDLNGAGLVLMPTAAATFTFMDYRPRSATFVNGRNVGDTAAATGTIAGAEKDFTIVIDRASSHLVLINVYAGAATSGVALLSYQENGDSNDRIAPPSGYIGFVVDNRAGGLNVTGVNGTASKAYAWNWDITIHRRVNV